MRDEIRRRVLTGAAAAATLLSLLTGSLPAAAASKYVVDDDLAQCPSAGYTTSAGLQNAINDAIANKVKSIEVCAGTYANVTISGANGLKIYANDPLARPRIDAPATNGGTVIDVQNSVKVTLDGLHVDGENFVDGGVSLMNGVLFHNSSGVIQRMVIYGIASAPVFSAAPARAISLVDDNADGKISTVKVSGNYVNTYHTAGVYAEGSVKATITGNTLSGYDHLNLNGYVGDAGVSLVANPYGTPSASILKNYFYYNSLGVALDSVPNVKISGNLFDSMLSGVSINVTCFAQGINGDKTQVRSNTFLHVADYMVEVNALAVPGVTCPSHANNLVVSGNTAYAAAQGTPVAVGGVATPAGAISGQIDKMQITKNTFYGYLDVADVTNATHLLVKSNTLYHR